MKVYGWGCGEWGNRREEGGRCVRGGGGGGEVWRSIVWWGVGISFEKKKIPTLISWIIYKYKKEEKQNNMIKKEKYLINIWNISRKQIEECT